MMCILPMTVLFIVFKSATACAPHPPYPSRTTERPITVGSTVSSGTGGTTTLQTTQTASTETTVTKTTESVSTPQLEPRLLVANQKAGRHHRTSTTVAPTTTTGF